ncbi:MAG: HEAT repeat domain-containing protein [Elusimicrobiota bacterium]
MCRKGLCLIAFGILAAVSGCVNVPQTQAPGQTSGASASNPGRPQGAPGAQIDPQILAALSDLMDNHITYAPTVTPQDSVPGTPIGDLLNLGSPAGYALRNRYLNIGVPLGEAFSEDYQGDPDFRKKSVTLARWAGNTETRASALILLAQQHNPDDAAVFQEAINFIDPGVRFGALEALALWGHPQKSVPLLAAEATGDPEPVLRVVAAGSLARLGDDSGLHLLRGFLNNGSWLVRALAARYLGDYGTAEDYDLLVSRIDQEQGNDFVVAEDCVGALKLFPKKNP